MTDRELAQRLFDALKRITRYSSPQELERIAERKYGLDGAEAIEMAYENVLEEARQAVRGVRRPADKKPLQQDPEQGGQG